MRNTRPFQSVSGNLSNGNLLYQQNQDLHNLHLSHMGDVTILTDADIFGVHAFLSADGTRERDNDWNKLKDFVGTPFVQHASQTPVSESSECFVDEQQLVWKKMFTVVFTGKCNYSHCVFLPMMCYCSLGVCL